MSAYPQLDYKTLELHGSANAVAGGLIVSDPGKLITDRTGLITCNAVLKIRKDRWYDMPPIWTQHPIFGPILTMEHQELELKGGFAVANCQYVGILGTTTTPVYSLYFGTSEEPIATHPDFKSSIGGTPVTPLNGAVFRNAETGQKVRAGGATTSTNIGYVFDSFTIMQDENNLNEFAGIQSYLETSQVTWRQSYNMLVGAVDLTNVGRINYPPGPVPNLPGNRNWLYTGVSTNQRCGIIEVSHDWRASGRRRWNSTIYG